MNNASICFGLYDNDVIIGFAAILHFPHPNNSRIKKVHRIVILPDYQGCGLGIKFLNTVAKLFVSQHFDVGITTSAKNFIMALRRNENWKMTYYGIGPKKGVSAQVKNTRNVKVATFYFYGK